MRINEEVKRKIGKSIREEKQVVKINLKKTSASSSFVSPVSS
ncbi:hypothetical protein ACSAZL_13740 [Methanosarcina sp. T3]